MKKYFPNEINKLNDFWEGTIEGEDPILSKFRRISDIPLRTGNIFKVPSSDNHGIYLDILLENGTIDDAKILFLLNKIFSKKSFNVEQKLDLIDTLNNIERGSFALVKTENTANKLKIKIELKNLIMEDF